MTGMWRDFFRDKSDSIVASGSFRSPCHLALSYFWLHFAKMKLALVVLVAILAAPLPGCGLGTRLDRVARAHYGHVTTGAARMAHVSSRESAQSVKTFFRLHYLY